MIELVKIGYLFRVFLVAAGISYVITGSQIGFWVRLLWWKATHWIPLMSLDALAFCPSCNAWWTGLVAAVSTGSSWIVALQCAFASCLLMAAAQSQWGLAAADEDEIRGFWKGKANGKTEERRR